VLDGRESELLRRKEFLVLEQEILLRLQKEGGIPDLRRLAEVSPAETLIVANSCIIFYGCNYLVIYLGQFLARPLRLRSLYF
jgi:hypothetical protein